MIPFSAGYGCTRLKAEVPLKEVQEQTGTWQNLRSLQKTGPSGSRIRPQATHRQFRATESPSQQPQPQTRSLPHATIGQRALDGQRWDRCFRNGMARTGGRSGGLLDNDGSDMHCCTPL